ncbi:MAG: hypothetical protein M1831_004932 [Alyxoria varia]|nr:MAG: hypothetical protein M1831_004932 [Alyxoria varia]
MAASCDTNLASLAGELIDHVASYCCQHSLVSLCRVARRYRQSAQPALLHEVLYTLYPSNQPEGWHAASRIYHPVAFYQALSSNSALRRHIVAAYLNWDDNCFEMPETLASHSATGYGATEVAAASLSLSIRIDLESNDQDEPDFNDLSNAFALRNLRTIHLKNMLRLNCEVPPSLPYGTHFSDVQHLMITGAGPPSKELAGLLSWPKHLRSITIDTSEDPNCPRAQPIEYCEDWSIAGLLEAMEPQRQNLESILFNSTDDSDLCDYEKTACQAFREFPSLRVLEIPLGTLFQPSVLSTFGDVLHPGSGLPMHEALPQGLEKLIFRYEENVVYCDYDEEPFLEFLKWLRGILPHVDIFPSLRLVRFDVSKQTGQGRMFPNGFLDVHRTQPLVDEFKRHGITLEIA